MLPGGFVGVGVMALIASGPIGAVEVLLKGAGCGTLMTSVARP